jgi:predicted amidophosphoribosyltransferase
MSRHPPKHRPYAGRTTCLRCDKQFWSWDRRQNRLCPRCRNELSQEPTEEPTHPLPPPVRQSRNIDEV